MALDRILRRKKDQLKKKEDDDILKEMSEDFFDAAQRRLKKDSYGKIGIVAATLITVMANVAFGILEQNKMVSLETVVYFILGIVGYAMYAVLQDLSKKIDLTNQDRAIELDRKEQVNKNAISTSKLKGLETTKKIEMLEREFNNKEERITKKHTQDLELRIPLFQNVQKEFLSIFQKDDVQFIMNSAPELVKAVSKLDEVLTRRSVMDDTIEKFRSILTEFAEGFSKMSKEISEINQLLNLLTQRNAETEMKFAQVDMAIQKTESNINLVSKRIDDFITIKENET